MIYIIIGGSCCGKTSFVKNSWLKGEEFQVKKDLLPYTETKKTLLLGRYINVEERERSGSDTISRSQIHLINEQIDRFLTKGKDIILEGDKITSRKILDNLLQYSTKLILIHCNLEVSLYRNKQNSTIVKSPTLKASLTKAKNIFIEYRDRMDGISIDTTYFSLDDFKDYNLYNYELYVKKNEDFKTTLF